MPIAGRRLSYPPQVAAAARRELEVPSHGNRAGPGILGTAAAEDAPAEAEGNVTTAAVELLRERTRGADGGRGRRPPGRSPGAPRNRPAGRSAPRGSGSGAAGHAVR